MHQGEHSAILPIFIVLPFVIKIFVLSIFEWSLYTGYTVLNKRLLFSNFLGSLGFAVDRLINSIVPEYSCKILSISHDKIYFVTLYANKHKSACSC